MIFDLFLLLPPSSNNSPRSHVRNNIHRFLFMSIFMWELLDLIFAQLIKKNIKEFLENVCILLLISYFYTKVIIMNLYFNNLFHNFSAIRIEIFIWSRSVPWNVFYYTILLCFNSDLAFQRRVTSFLDYFLSLQKSFEVQSFLHIFLL